MSYWKRRYILDLYCGAGGVAKGYYDAGFEPIGVDNMSQPNYPYRFIQADALEVLDLLLLGGSLLDLGGPDLVLGDFVASHASPPCQEYSRTRRLHSVEHPMLIVPTRDRLKALGLPYIIENVVGAPLRDPILLCGNSFPKLRTYRHRLFELSGFECPRLLHTKHRVKVAKMGKCPKPDEYMHVVGHFAGQAEARAAMGINWMTRDEISEAVPPAYTRYIGSYLRASLS
jgi:DNA (cytosine-5)-methyltransferase 1